MNDEILEHAKKEALEKHVHMLGEDLRAKGIFPPNLKKSYVKDLVWHKLCQVCGKENPEGMARVCSSTCYMKSPMS